MTVVPATPMVELHAALEQLPVQHRNALQWFVDKAGTDQPWTGELDDGTRLVSMPKGIYKPKWSEYALSVRQVLSSRYPDGDPVFRSDGTWTYAYFQENKNVDEGNGEFTNRGLHACWRSQVPVGVMRQVSAKSPVTYRVLGVALVSGWEGGFFYLEGFSPEGYAHLRGPRAEIELLQRELGLQAGNNDDVLGPESELDNRKRIVAEIIRRQGQSEFRQRLLRAYGTRCAVTGWDFEAALEAAHIMPYRGPNTNQVDNGLLLRADIHTLFDLGKLAIDEQTMKVLISSDLVGTRYEELAGLTMRLPSNTSDHPSANALKRHREWSGLP